MSPVAPQSIGQVIYLGPFLILVATLLLLLLVDVVARAAGARNGLGLVGSLTLGLMGTAAAAGHALYLWYNLGRGDLPASQQLFISSGATSSHGIAWQAGALVTDHFSLLITLFVCGILAVTSLLLYPHLKRRQLYKAEVYPLLLGSASGMMLLGMSRDLLITFIAIEIVSLPLYVLCGLNERSAVSREASLKYFLLGAFASGFFIYGSSMIYGVVGHLSYAAIKQYSENAIGISPFLMIGVALVGAGLAFKLALVPFHAWVPDVYQGAPTPLTGFMAAGVKVAVFAAALRVVIEGLQSVNPDIWRTGLVVFAVASMVVGNLFALHQMSAKRLLAYSAISHTGYLAVGLCAATPASANAMLVYLVGYSAAVLGSFALIDYLAPDGQDDIYLDELNDLSKRAPVSAMALAILVFSLAGFPLTLGFIGKLTLFVEAWNVGLFALVIIAVLNSVIGVYYYLRFVLAMYMQPKLPGASELQLRRISAPYLIPVLVTTVVTVGLGVMPGELLRIINMAHLGW